MPLFTSSEEWQKQSSLLIRAQPSTTHITTKYNIPNLASARHLKKQRLRETHNAAKAASTTINTSTSDPTKDASATTESNPAAPHHDARTAKASFELKTFDPVTGVTLKYRTDKAAEVSRLIAATGRLARDMAGMPEEDASTAAAGLVAKTATAVVDEVVNTVKGAVPAVVAKGSEGAKKKKKKGKK